LFLNLIKFDGSKSIFVALMSVYGINSTKAYLILRRLGLVLDVKILDVSFLNMGLIDALLARQGATYEDSLRRRVNEAIQRKIGSGSFKGRRFIQGLPTRGQRTHSNAGTPRRLLRGKFSILKSK